MLQTYIALLRGINIGGKNKLPMPALAALFTEAGCIAVQTYIQSGNVIFKASLKVADGLPAQISALIVERFDLRVPVVLRTAEQLAQAFQNNPFLAQGLPAETLHMMFLAALPQIHSLFKAATSTCISQMALPTASSLTLILTPNSPPSAPAATGKPSPRCLA